MATTLTESPTTTTTTTDRSRTVRTTPERPRTDIQALRALAVTLVFAYHLWPGRLPGGFVGVDVFFVISGFLITQHLLTKPPRRPTDVLAFWARRIRRLLPASLLVLAVSLFASRVLAPETQWATTARQVRSAALYVVNWRLAADAVDYSAADAAASPVQHFWSLSVEEQFYLVWPVLIGVTLLVATLLRRRPLATVRVVLGAVVAASLVFSVWTTAVDPARAYFVTPTRVWELGLGGLLAALLLHRRYTERSNQLRPRRARALAVWLGLGLIAVAAWTYSSDTPFPGWQAAVPVLGAVAVIGAGDPRGSGAPGALLALRPVQWLGGVSYAVYLWHWPLLVLLPGVSGSIGALDRAAVVVVTLVLAALTKRYVEDPWRRGRTRGRAVDRRSFLAAGTAMAVIVALTGVQLTEVSRRQTAQDADVAAALAAAGPCFGAAALGDTGQCPPQDLDTVVPALGQAPLDQYDIEHRFRADESCWASEPRFELRTCSFGDPAGTVRVAVVGNSHAAQWMGALEDIASRRGWQLTTMVAHHCALAVTPQEFDAAETTRGCHDWVSTVTDRVRDGSYDLVVMSNKIENRYPGLSRADAVPEFTDGYETVLRSWSGTRTPVVAIRDTPEPAITVGRVPECLEQHRDDPAACGAPPTRWLPADPVEAAVRRVDDPRVRSVDLNDHLCTEDFCPPVVGGVVVYSDFSHLTTTYVRTLAPYLDDTLVRAVRGGG